MSESLLPLSCIRSETLPSSLTLIVAISGNRCEDIVAAFRKTPGAPQTVTSRLRTHEIFQMTCGEE